MATISTLPGMRFAQIGLRTTQALVEASGPKRSHSTRVEKVTPRLVAETMVDELVSAIFRGGNPGQQREQLVQANEDADALYGMIRLGLLPADPIHFHQSPSVPTTVTTRIIRSRRARVEHISFPSRYQVPTAATTHWNAWEANLEMHAYILRAGGADRPWLINLHGHRQGMLRDLTTFRSARYKQRYDLNVLHPVLPHHGSRRDGTSPEPPPGLDFSLNVFGIAQSVWDVRRCIRWIRTQSDAPIIVHGISLGAYVASLVAGLDEDVHTVIAGVPVIDFPAIMLAHAHRMKADEDDLALMAGDTVKAIHRLISPLGLDTLVPLERRFIYAGRVDRVSAPEQALTLWRHWGCPRIEWYGGGHVGHIWDGSVWNLVDEAVQASIS